MSGFGIGQWFEVAVLSAALVWCLCIYVPYLLKYVRRKNWPIGNATIQKGAIGLISGGRYRGDVHACFVGYAFKIEGERYGGYFVLVGNEATLQNLNESLVGAPLQVRYDPADPNTSLLLDYKDLRFAGLTASQDPGLLDQAPSFDLQDAIRG